jgi:hypothetical protein
MLCSLDSLRGADITHRSRKVTAIMLRLQPENTQVMPGGSLAIQRRRNATRLPNKSEPGLTGR